MTEPTVLDDVRAAKVQVDAECASFEELGDRLRVIEAEYRERRGAFASVPREWPEWVRQAIDAAEDQPGRALLDEIRRGRTA
jgi:hypothetical protein